MTVTARKPPNTDRHSPDKSHYAGTAWNSTLKNRTKAMRPGSGVARHTTMKRSGRLKVRRTSKRFAKRRCQPFLDWLKTRPCFVTDLVPGQNLVRDAEDRPLPGWTVVIDPAHLPRSRAAGAYDLGGALPLWHELHEEQHRIGIKSWLVKYGLTVDGVKQVAELYAAEWRATQTQGVTP